MLGYIIRYGMAIFLTSLSYYFGSQLVTDGMFFWQALVIGFLVVTIGAVTEKFGAPIWLIVLMPFPIGMVALYVFLAETMSVWFLTYLVTLMIYTFIHIIASYFFRFHSLIPAWKLSGEKESNEKEATQI